MLSIIYATLSGHNLELAYYLKSQVASWPIQVTVEDAAVAGVPTGPLFFCPATYGEGELSDEGADFLTELSSCQFSHPYWVVGIGDQCYGDDFCGAVTLADQTIAAAGGTRLAPPLCIDYELSAKVKEQLNVTLEHLKESILDQS